MTTAEKDEKAIFLAALEQAGPQKRSAYLEGACAGDAELRQRVEVLLAAHAEPVGPLDAPPPGLGAPPMIDQSLTPGAVIGQYKLLEQIGEGGFGIVFMAEQQHPVRRKAALKVLKPGMDTRQVVARFEAERQALAIMDHPNIAKVFDGGATTSGRPYFVMELVKGVPITEFCDENHFTPRARLELFVPICQAVHHAHQKGIIHRDLKPSNILVVMHDTIPVPKIIDFGVAKALGQELTEKTLFTGFAQMIGTPLYMSPEQAGQSGLDIDTRSDIYSLGVLLYELLTGTTPFNKERLGTAAYDEVRRIIREEEPVKPSTRMSTLGQSAVTISANRKSDPDRLRQLLRGELDWIVMKALEKDRNRRYESASSFAGDVERYLNDEHVLACPPSAAYRLRKFVRRNKGPVLAASLILLVLVGGIIGTTWGMFRATQAEADARNQASQKETALTDKVAALADAEDKLFLALVQQARAERSSGRAGQRFSALKAIREAAAIRITPELRTEAAAALVLPDVEVAHEWEAWREDTVGVAFDESLTRYVGLDQQGRLSICRLNAGREEIVDRLPAHGEPQFGGPWVSRDGRLAAYGHSRVRVGVLGAIRVWRLDGQAPEVLLDEPAGLHEAAIAFHLNGKQLAIGHADKSVSIYDVATGQRVQRLTLDSVAYHLSFHPRESRLAVAGGEAVQLFDSETGQQLASLRHAAVTWTQSVSWHPDGRRLAVGGNDRKIHIWDTETTREIMSPWSDPIVTGMYVAYNHAGDRLLSVDWGGHTGLWDAVSGRLLLKMPGTFGLVLSPDDGLLGVQRSDSQLRLRRLANGRELRVIHRRGADSQDRIRCPIVHTDGRIAMACTEHWLVCFDVINGEQLAAVKLSRVDGLYPLCFLPPGCSPDSNTGEAGWLTAGYSGLCFWPAQRDSRRPAVLSVGPPREFGSGLASAFTQGAGASADGRIVAVPLGSSTVLLNRDQPQRRVELGPQFDVRFAAVSPDGRRVVTCSHWTDGRSKSARIWDAETGEQVHELPLEDSTWARFSPDGRWLMTRTHNLGCRLWEVGDWREVRRFDYGAFCFSPDSKLIAIGDVFGVIRLVETSTGKELARLTGPDTMWYHPSCFTPDQTRLLVTGSGETAVYIFDLRLIRRQLKELGLDWDWPEFQPADSAAASAHPLKVEVLGAAAEPTKNEADHD